MRVKLRGNNRGDFNQAAPELLSTLDSATDACTGATLAHPMTIENGELELTACDHDVAGPSLGQPADLHDLTLLVLRIDGIQSTLSVTPNDRSSCVEQGPTTACVLGEKVSRAAGHSQHHPQSLAFTGMWITIGIAIGVVAMLVGILLTVFGRRRQRRSHSPLGA